MDEIIRNTSVEIPSGVSAPLPSFMEWIHGQPKCTSADEAENIYQMLGYILVVLIAVSATRWTMLFFNKKNQQHSDAKRVGLMALIAVQFLGAYILYCHCKNCDCWTGMWKGIILSMFSMLVAQAIYGETFSLERLRRR